MKGEISRERNAPGSRLARCSSSAIQVPAPSCSTSEITYSTR